MLDNQLIQLVLTNLHAVLLNIGQNVDCVQKYQPTAQGVPTADTLFLYKIGPDKRIGFPARKDIWTPSTTATFQGFIAGNVLTVDNPISGTVAVNGMLVGPGIPANALWITQNLTGSGGAGTYQLNQPFTISTSDVISTIAGEVHTETTQYASTFQMSGLSPQDPANPNQRTASDLLNYAAYAMQSSAMIQALEAQGVGILNVPEVRNPYFMDDRDRFEASPSFDFVLTHKQIIVSQTPVVQSIEVQILEV